MKAHPILFGGEMPRAILDGRKTQTRRIVKMTDSATAAIKTMGQPERTGAGYRWFNGVDSAYNLWFDDCPYGKPGDLLWVREKFQYLNDYDKCRPSGVDEYALIRYSDGCLNKESPIYDSSSGRWGRKRSSRFMPRVASRLTLNVKDIWVERLREISEEDAKAEGATPWFPSLEHYPGCTEDYKARGGSYRNGFHALWDSINKKRGFGWYENPLVWVVEFSPKNRE